MQPLLISCEDVTGRVGFCCYIAAGVTPLASGYLLGSILQRISSSIFTRAACVADTKFQRASSTSDAMLSDAKTMPVINDKSPDADQGTANGHLTQQLSAAESIWIAESLSLPREALFVAVVCMAQFCTRQSLLSPPSFRLPFPTLLPKMRI